MIQEPSQSLDRPNVLNLVNKFVIKSTIETNLLLNADLCYKLSQAYSLTKTNWKAIILILHGLHEDEDEL